MSEQSDRFRSPKLDQSPYFFHFIKGTEADAKNVLRKILSQKKLLTTRLAYLCFTATPVTHLLDFFEVKKRNTFTPIYQPYGIGFGRDTMIRDFGMKNVIYGDNNDYSELRKIGMDWRYERIDVQIHDFEWLREWRLHRTILDFSRMSFDDIVVITPTTKDLLEITGEYKEQEIVYQGENPDEDEWDVVEYYDRKWKGISIDKIRSLQLISDYKMFEQVANQSLNEEMMEEYDEVSRKELDEMNRRIAEMFRKSLGL